LNFFQNSEEFRDFTFFEQALNLNLDIDAL